MSEIKMSMTVPLDDDGFLRRECPYCRREFKVYPEQDAQSDEVADEQEEMYCPYCGQSADLNSWWTPEQIRYAREIVMKKIVEPELNKFQKDIERMSRNSFIKTEVKKTEARIPRISAEADDMKIVELKCCGEKIKVDEDWDKKIYCIACGKSS